MSDNKRNISVTVNTCSTSSVPAKCQGTCVLSITLQTRHQVGFPWTSSSYHQSAINQRSQCYSLRVSFFSSSLFFCHSPSIEPSAKLVYICQWFHSVSHSSRPTEQFATLVLVLSVFHIPSQWDPGPTENQSRKFAMLLQH